MKGAREECLTLVQPEGGPSQGRATHMPRQCRRKGTRREFIEGVGVQWELRGAVAHRDLGRTPSHPFAIAPPRGRRGEGPMDSPFRIEYLNAGTATTSSRSKSSLKGRSPGGNVG